jgi:hypothetical protein
MEMPGAGVLNLGADGQGSLASPSSQQPRPTLSQTPTGSSSGSLAAGTMQVPAINPNLLPTPMGPSASASALTPPDETPGKNQNHNQARKHRQGNTGGSGDAIESPGVPDTSAAFSPNKRRRMSSRDMQHGSMNTAAQGIVGAIGSPAVAQVATPLLEEILEAMKTRAPPRWREQALDLFFRDFAAEEYDLQVKISENVLSNEHKAMVFCKMPERVRQHWVSKFREMHQLNNRST